MVNRIAYEAQPTATLFASAWISNLRAMAGQKIESYNEVRRVNTRIALPCGRIRGCEVIEINRSALNSTTKKVQ